MIKFKSYVAALLLLVMMAYSVPKELLHELHHHTDTVDVVCKSYAAKEISMHHIHCDAFHFDVPVLFYSFNVITFTGNFTPYVYTHSCTEDYFFYNLFPINERGPPVFFVG